MYGTILYVCVAKCVYLCGMCWYDFDTHLDMTVSCPLFTLQNTATATTPAMAAVNRTPPIKPLSTAPTPVLKQSQATYVCGKDREKLGK